MRGTSSLVVSVYVCVCVYVRACMLLVLPLSRDKNINCKQDL